MTQTISRSRRTAATAASRRIAGTPTGSSRRLAAAALLSLGIAVLVAQVPGHAQAQAPDALPYSSGYLVTGDYVAGGVDVTSAAAVNGYVTGTISMTGTNAVPPGAEILAAFLYWESIYADPSQAAGVKFRGIPVPAIKTSSQSLLKDASCFASGSNLTMSMNRADVLPFLPVQEDAAGLKNGRRLVNDADLLANGWALNTVTLPEGHGNQVPESAGASLVVIYRDTTQPLRKIVLYDGISILKQGATMSQTLRGFYQSSATKSAKLTHIASSGSKNKTDQLFFNGNLIGGGAEPFPASGANSDRFWFTKTLDHNVIDNLMHPLAAAPASGYGETATTSVSFTKSNPYGCMAWAAVIFSTAVKDADHDGLPDGLEDAAGGLTNPNGEPLPNLNAMGASSSHPDLFVEINAMKADSQTGFGYVEHDHMPAGEVLKMVGDVYASHGITPHFDVGDMSAYGTAYGHDADAYLVPAGSRGGEQILERACVAGAGEQCEFPDYPGTVAWKFGFQKYRDAPVGAHGEELTSDQQAYCAANPTGMIGGIQCDPDRTRFDRVRSEFFHYVLYAHARARPKSTFPCLDSNNSPTEYLGGGSCAPLIDNPDFHVPKSISGTADLPGGNVMITLGLWGDAATTFVQASTTLHELGHNLDLWHGGVPAVIGTKTAGTFTYVEPNCKPNYLSSMSYLFQVHGLYTDEDNDGDGFPDQIPRLDYSSQTLATIGEPSLNDGPLFGIGALDPLYPKYQPAWFVPASSDLAVIQGLTPATKFCNGSKFSFDPTLPARPAGWVEMARAQAPLTGAAIDWNGDIAPNGALNQNVNFDGTPLNEQTLAGGVPIITSALFGFNDWAHLRLDQIGAGRSSGRFKSFEGSSFEGSSFEGSSFEGSSFEGSSFEGSSFEGSSFEGSSFEGSSFEGSSFEGSSFEGSSFEGSSFEGSSFEGSSFEGSSFEGQELDFLSAKALGRAAPHSMQASLIHDPAPDPNHQIQLTWKAPTFGKVATYQVYRLQGATITPATVTGATAVGSPTPGTSALDTTELPNGVPFIYFAKAAFDEVPPISRNSNFAKIIAANDPPQTTADAYSTLEDTALVVDAAHGLLVNDTDDDSPHASLSAVLVTGPSHGTLVFNADGSFTYTPAADYNGPDAFTYQASNGIWSGDGSTPMNDPLALVPATVSITVIPVNDVPSFTKGANQIVSALAGAQSVAGWATSISAGPANESGQAVNFIIASNTNSALFSAQPAISPTGTLTYTPSPSAFGIAVIMVKIHDDGGTANSGVDTSAAQTFTITVTPGVYGVLNVLNVPPLLTTTSATGPTISLKWMFTGLPDFDADDVVASANAQPQITLQGPFTCGTLFPSGQLLGPFTYTYTSTDPAWAAPTAANGQTWQFNWTAVTPAGANLPVGCYFVTIKSLQNGQIVPRGSIRLQSSSS